MENLSAVCKVGGSPATGRVEARNVGLGVPDAPALVRRRGGENIGGKVTDGKF